MNKCMQQQLVNKKDMNLKNSGVITWMVLMDKRKWINVVIKLKSPPQSKRKNKQKKSHFDMEPLRLPLVCISVRKLFLFYFFLFLLVEEVSRIQTEDNLKGYTSEDRRHRHKVLMRLLMSQTQSTLFYHSPKFIESLDL